MDVFVPAEAPKFTIAEVMLKFGLSKTQAREFIRQTKSSNLTQWINDTYSVGRFDDGDTIHLSIKRRDIQPIHDWRDMQEIKNLLVGEENEGMEIYPAESRRVDSANQYHIWCAKDPKYRIPIGFNEGRMVIDSGFIERAGGKQRPLPKRDGNIVSILNTPKGE